MARAFGSYPKCRRFKSYFRYQRPGGQAVKTPPFHGGNTSSILVRVTTPLSLGRGIFIRLCFDLKSPFGGKPPPIRRCGGIGRHKGLKIPRSKIRTGSSPVTGTKKGSFLTVFFCCSKCSKTAYLCGFSSIFYFCKDQLEVVKSLLRCTPVAHPLHTGCTPFGKLLSPHIRFSFRFTIQ